MTKVASSDGLTALSEALHAALGAYQETRRESRTDLIDLSDLEPHDVAVRVLGRVSGLLALMAKGQGLSARDEKMLRNTAQAMRSPAPTGAGVPEETVALAHAIISEQAPRYLQLRGDAALLRGRTAKHWAMVVLIDDLAARVHEGFAWLHGLDAEAHELLGRFTDTKNRPKGSMAATGVLIELNKLAGSPLGKLTRRGVDRAVTNVRDAEGTTPLGSED